MINEGTYLGRARDFQIRSAQNTSTEWVEVEFDVKVNADGEDEEIQPCTWKGFLTDKAMDRTIEALRACGWYGEDVTNLLEDGLALNEVELVIQHDEYKGKTKAVIAFVNKKGSGPKPLDEARMKSIAERVRKKAAESVPLAPPEEEGKDKLPF